MKRKLNNFQHPGVLRDVVLRTVPHMLVRPGRPPARNNVHIAVPALLQESASPAKDVPLADTTLLAAQAEVLQATKTDGYRVGLEEGRELGQRRGYDDGYKEGSQKAQQLAEQQIRQTIEKTAEQAQEQLRVRTQRLDLLLKAFVEAMDARLHAAEDDMAAFCFEIICRIMGDQLSTQEGIRQSLLHAVQSAGLSMPLEIRVHVEDLRFMLQDENMARCLAQSGYNKVQWIADESVGLGGCILHSPEGGLDARLEIQLQGLKKFLQQMRATREALPEPHLARSDQEGSP